MRDCTANQLGAIVCYLLRYVGIASNSSKVYLDVNLVMLKLLREWSGDLLHLVLPHVCTGCGSDMVGIKDLLCLHCLHSLPGTGFIAQDANPVERMFYGRVQILNAAAGFYFTKESLLQHLVVQLKYRGNKEIGTYMGVLLGRELMKTDRFSQLNAIIPLPLNKQKEKRRGYNQAASISNGIYQQIGVSVYEQAVARKHFTETQTHKNRLERWQNMDGVFIVTDPAKLAGKHILLVDDVVTTGATLEACAQEILKVEGVRLSILTLAYTLL